jgi:hypothetical protein
MVYDMTRIITDVLFDARLGVHVRVVLKPARRRVA